MYPCAAGKWKFLYIGVNARFVTHQQHLPNIEMHFDCPVAFLSIDFHFRMGVFELDQTLWDLDELHGYGIKLMKVVKAC